MPQVLFENHAKRQAVVRFMPVPKRISELNAWFKTARSVINAIPDPSVTDWFIKKSEATFDRVQFEMQNTLGEQCLITIDRTKKGLGA